MRGKEGFSLGTSSARASQASRLAAISYLINQTPGKKLRHGVALRASAALVESCKLLS